VPIWTDPQVLHHAAAIPGCLHLSDSTHQLDLLLLLPATLASLLAPPTCPRPCTCCCVACRCCIACWRGCTATGLGSTGPLLCCTAA
jgi:hypothetical protein